GRKRSRDNATTIGLFPSRHGKGPYGPGCHYREGTHHQPLGGGSWRLGRRVSTGSSAKFASSVARLYDGFESQDFIWRKSPPGCHRQQYEGARHQRRDARHRQQYLPPRGRSKSPSRLQHLQQPRHLGYIDRHHVHDSVYSGVKQGVARHRQQYHLGHGGGGYYQQGRILGPYDNDDGNPPPTVRWWFPAIEEERQHEEQRLVRFERRQVGYRGNGQYQQFGRARHQQCAVFLGYEEVKNMTNAENSTNCEANWHEGLTCAQYQHSLQRAQEEEESQQEVAKSSTFVGSKLKTSQGTSSLCRALLGQYDRGTSFAIEEVRQHESSGGIASPGNDTSTGFFPLSPSSNINRFTSFGGFGGGGAVAQINNGQLLLEWT
ncbi:hypothetical protein D6D22_09141, partial [Aureobasidium pullulans]